MKVRVNCNGNRRSGENLVMKIKCQREPSIEMQSKTCEQNSRRELELVSSTFQSTFKGWLGEKW